jgi:hypothetical protein
MADITVTVDTSQVTKAEKAFDKLGTSILDQVRKADMLERGYKDLDNAFNKGYISLDRYAKGVQQLDAVIDGLRKGTTQATAAQQRLAAATQQSTRRIGQGSTLIQQSGYQIGDFIVQVQSGTNAFVAFGQQATQVAGTLTLLGGPWVWIGSILGVVIPLFTAVAAGIMRTGDSAKESKTLVEEFTKSVDGVNSALEEAEVAAGQFQNAVDKIQFSRVILEFESAGKVAGEAFAASWAEVAFGFITTNTPLFLDYYTKGFQTWGQVSGGLSGDAFAEAFGREAGNALLNQGFLDEVDRAISELDTSAIDQALLVLEAYMSTADQVGRAYFLSLTKIREKVEEVAWATSLVGENNKDAVAVAIKLADEIGRAGVEALQVAGVDITSGVDAAAKAAAELSGNLGVSLERAMGIMRLKANIGKPKEVILDPRDPRYDPIAARMAMDKPGTVSPFDPSRLPKPAGSSGGVGGSSVSPIQQAEEYLQKLEREAEFKSTLVGLSDEQVAIETRREQLVNQLNGYEEGLSDTYTQRIEEIIKTEAETRKLMEAEQQRQQLMNTIEGHIENAFMSMVDGSKSVEDAFKSMLRNIILAIYQEKVAKAGANAIMNLLGLANGGAFERGGKFTAYANGGVVGSPTMFGHSGGLGVMGEAGPEAIMPLKRGKNGKLGVQMEGNSGNVTVIQNFNMSANGDESVKRIIRQETPRIAEQAKAAVVDAKRRGGTYGRSF